MSNDKSCWRMTDEKHAQTPSELDPQMISEVLGIPVALVMRRMDSGLLPFRSDRDRRLAKLEDVMKLKSVEDEKSKRLRELADTDDVDYQVDPKL
jgi:hypothetical protein